MVDTRLGAAVLAMVSVTQQWAKAATAIEPVFLDTAPAVNKIGGVEGETKACRCLSNCSVPPSPSFPLSFSTQPFRVVAPNQPLHHPPTYRPPFTVHPLTRHCCCKPPYAGLIGYHGHSTNKSHCGCDDFAMCGNAWHAMSCHAV
jgi:hypothetical protein